LLSCPQGRIDYGGLRHITFFEEKTAEAMKERMELT